MSNETTESRLGYLENSVNLMKELIGDLTESITLVKEAGKINNSSINDILVLQKEIKDEINELCKRTVEPEHADNIIKKTRLELRVDNILKFIRIAEDKKQYIVNEGHVFCSCIVPGIEVINVAVMKKHEALRNPKFAFATSEDFDIIESDITACEIGDFFIPDSMSTENYTDISIIGFRNEKYISLYYPEGFVLGSCSYEIGAEGRTGIILRRK